MREIHHYNRWIFFHLVFHVVSRVLEMGCGRAPTRPSCAGCLACVDTNPASLRGVAQLLGGDPAVAIVPGVLGLDLTFPAASFDSIVCHNVLEHTENDRGALHQLANWLALGGALLLQVLAPSGSWAPSTLAWDTTAAPRRHPCGRRSRRLGWRQ